MAASISLVNRRIKLSDKSLSWLSSKKLDPTRAVANSPYSIRMNEIRPRNSVKNCLHHRGALSETGTPHYVLTYGPATKR